MHIDARADVIGNYSQDLADFETAQVICNDKAMLLVQLAKSGVTLR